MDAERKDPNRITAWREEVLGRGEVPPRYSRTCTERLWMDPGHSLHLLRERSAAEERLWSSAWLANEWEFRKQRSSRKAELCGNVGTRLPRSTSI